MFYWKFLLFFINKDEQRINSNILEIESHFYKNLVKLETFAESERTVRIDNSAWEIGFMQPAVSFVCLFYSRLSNLSAIRLLSPLPVTGLQI